MIDVKDEMINDNFEEILILFINKKFYFNKDYLDVKLDKFSKRASILPSLEFIIEENSSF